MLYKRCLGIFLKSYFYVYGETKIFTNFQKTLPVNLKYAAPRANTMRRAMIIAVIWDPWEGSSRRGDV